MDFGFFGIIDVVIVGLVVLFLVIGWKKGFLEKIIDMASSVFGLIASILLARPFSTVLDKWFGASIETSVTDYLLSRSDLFNASIVDGAESIRPALEQMSLPDFMIDWIIKQAASIDSSTIVGAIAPSITSLALLFIAFLSLFFGSMILFFLLRILARGITSIPVIKQIDKFLGLLFGFLKVALLVYILLFILALVINIPAVNDVIFEFLDKDMQLSTDKFRLSKELYNNNLLKNIINIFVTIF